MNRIISFEEISQNPTLTEIRIKYLSEFVGLTWEETQEKRKKYFPEYESILNKIKIHQYTLSYEESQRFKYINWCIPPSIVCENEINLLLGIDTSENCCP